MRFSNIPMVASGQLPARLAMGITYNGAAYKGWQKQRHDFQTVQHQLEQALSSVANEPIQIFCAGRTDTGVHASGQVIHFDTLAVRSEKSWILGANSLLADDISVLWVRLMDKQFHARFSATARHYRYLISNTAVKPAILACGLSWYRQALDVDAMQQAAEYLLGEHDFSAFRSSQCQSHSPYRNIMSLQVRRYGEMVSVDVKANAFLHHMVRNIVGTLVPVGIGSVAPKKVKEILLSRDRSQAGVTAPPTGLYLINVSYPEEFSLPATKLGLDFLAFNEE